MFDDSTAATADAHRNFLDFSADLTRAYGRAFELQTELLRHAASDRLPDGIGKEHLDLSPPAPAPSPQPAFSREMCMEFAVGSAAKVLGPEFEAVDTYKARVRLPDEPLMLVDRILKVEGEKCGLGSGRIVTEHDVLTGAWYLDGGRAPVCISVEAGQADLFLCAYLGIDLAVKGKRTYRLLDAKVTFHRGLPQPGDIIRYHIEIKNFVRQGDTYLFFFGFEGFIGDTPLITMKDGCAGFFTEQEIRTSGGIVSSDPEPESGRGKIPPDWKELAPLCEESYDEEAVGMLREGSLSACFGPAFEGIVLSEALKLPGGRMALIHRVLSFEPAGGAHGLGRIRAEADIHPDDWFLTCHFVDDMVMPGTLMYECCSHTLRVFIQRMGWVTDKPDVCYEPVMGVESVLKCRGPVTPETRRVIYEVDIKKIGYAPEPHAIADAQMYADGQLIVTFKDMSIKMTGIEGREIEAFWVRRQAAPFPGYRDATAPQQDSKAPAFDTEKVLEFATGNPSRAFGARYRPFDNDRVIARLPAPPYSFLDRVSSCGPEQWVLKPDGWIDAEYDIHPEAWFFEANRSPYLPFCSLLEIALQPCGWLAAYMGSALRSDIDLKFRNLGGDALLHGNIDSSAKTLTIRARLTNVSDAADMIIEQFTVKLLHAKTVIYEGDTYFGFFSENALSQQVGIRNAEALVYRPPPNEDTEHEPHVFSDDSPLTPEDAEIRQRGHRSGALAMPSKALRMIDRIDRYEPEGGPAGLGFIRGSKTVDPDEWFFTAHFYQDPVWPGSLGIEALLQLLKYIALSRWKEAKDRCHFALLTGVRHAWTYRGQVLPGNKHVVLEAVVTRIEDAPTPLIQADGFLKVDGRYIYKMENFGIQLIRKR